MGPDRLLSETFVGIPQEFQEKNLSTGMSSVLCGIVLSIDYRAEFNLICSFKYDLD